MTDLDPTSARLADDVASTKPLNTNIMNSLTCSLHSAFPMFSPSIYTVSIFQLGLTSALSAYGLYLSYQNITRLQQYEEKSEKAAEWSNTAAQRLHKTRTTQTSGTVTV